MRRAAWILLLAGALPSLPAFAQSPDSKQAVLADLWRRRVLAPDKNEWTPADLLLLSRMRRAEDDDACGFLRAKVHGLLGLAVYIRDPKTRETHLRLTKAGFDKYLFLRSQDALAYFQAHDASYKWAFLLKDMDGAPLFDSAGLLTDSGQIVYDRLLANLEVHYRLADGQIGGNRAPPKPVEPAPEAAPPVYHRRPMTQAPPEVQPQPAEQAPAQEPEQQPPAQEPQPPAGPNPYQNPQPPGSSTSQPPPDDQAAPQQAPGPAPQDSD